MKRFLIIGIIVALLVATPIVAYVLLNQNTNTQSHANPASSLLFEDLTAPAVVGQTVPVKVDVNPSSNGSSNSVSFVKLTIAYDGSKLQADNNALVPSDGFPVTLEGPTNTCGGSNNTACTITATLSIGPNPANAVTSQKEVATINFKALAPTDANAPVQLTFVSGQNQILSIATTDQPAENVFTRGIPTNITIIAANTTPGAPTNTPVPGAPTNTQAPSSGGTGGTGGTGGSSNQPPVCNNLTVTKVSTDSSGMTYQLSASGTDSDGTVSKVTFNFGDGNVANITDGMGTNSVSATTSHTFASAGTYTVSALLTDDQGAISTSSTCKQSLSVGSSIAQANPTATPTPIPANPQKIPPTGPGNVILGVGLAGVGLVLVGGLFLLGL